MKKILLITIITLFVSPAFADELSIIAIDAAADVITAANMDTASKSAVVELENFTIVYTHHNNKTVNVLVMNTNNETLENTTFKKGSIEYEKLSAVLEYKAAEKQYLLASF